MKKQLFFAASALLMLASCSSESVDFTQADVASQQNEAITFETYMGKVGTTRASATALVTSNLKNFGVFAFHSDGTTLASTDKPNFMFDQLVSGGSGSYTYSPVKYWPNQDGDATNGSESNTDYLSFFAYAPRDTYNDGTNVSTTNVNGIFLTDGTTTYQNSTTYTTSAPKIYYNPLAASFAYDNNVDVLYAVCQKNVTKPHLASAGNPGVVTLQFKHALAKIGETVNIRYLLDQVNAGGTTGSTVDSNTDILLKAVYIWIEGAENEILDKGWLNLETGTWSEGNGGYHAAISSYDAAETAKLAMKKTGGSFAGLTSDEVTNANTQLTDFKGFLMIPANGKEITIKARAIYDVKTTDVALEGGNSTVENDITNSYNVTLVPNKKYNLNLVLGIETLKLNATVLDWETDTSVTEINIPNNEI